VLLARPTSPDITTILFLATANMHFLNCIAALILFLMGHGAIGAPIHDTSSILSVTCCKSKCLSASRIKTDSSPADPNASTCGEAKLNGESSTACCGQYTIDTPGDISSASPLASDCQGILNIITDGEWDVNFGTSQLAKYNTCKFMVHNSNFSPVAIGDYDVASVVKMLIDKFESNGLVGGKGRMQCNRPTDAWVDFYLSHTSQSATELAASPSPGGNKPMRRDKNFQCYDDEFKPGETTQGSPLVEDCKQIMSNIAGWGEWRVTSGQHQLVEYGTCAFGINNLGTGVSKIGNGDIIRVMAYLIDHNQWNGLVGGRGDFVCYDIALPSQEQIEFAIFHHGQVKSLAEVFPRGTEPEPDDVNLFARGTEPAPADDLNYQCEEDYFFPSQTTPGSPLVADCQQMLRNIQTDPHAEWHVVVEFHKLIQYKTCAFGVDVKGIGVAKIGNGDITRVVNKLIDNNQWNGLVGGSGWFMCWDIDSVWTDNTWFFLYHNDASKAEISPRGIETAQVDRGIEAAPVNLNYQCFNDFFAPSETTLGSPRATDCLQMLINISRDPNSEWHVPIMFHKLIQYDTCAFGVDNQGSGVAKIGNGDITRVVSKLISDYQWNGLVGGHGWFDCYDISISTDRVQFNIYYNDDWPQAEISPGVIESVSPRGIESAPDPSLNYQCYHDWFGSNSTTTDSPGVSDCRQMLTNISTGKAEWRLADGFRKLIQYGTCAFSVHNYGAGIAKVGNGDITRVVEQMITNNEMNGLVSGVGQFDCFDIVQGPFLNAVGFNLYRDDASLRIDTEVSANDISVQSTTDASPTTKVFTRDSNTAQCFDDWYSAENRTNPASPKVADCQEMVRRISEIEEWHIKSGIVELATYESCAFDVNYIPGGVVLKISGSDIIRVVTQAIENNKSVNRIGVEGSFNCWDLSGFNPGTMKFYIYANKGQTLAASSGASSPQPTTAFSPATIACQSRSLPSAAELYPMVRGNSALLSRNVNISYCDSDKIDENNTSGGSPLVADCRQMLSNIAKDGEWHVLDGFHKLIEYGTCAFGFKNDMLLAVLKVGNGDIIRVVNRLIDEYEWFGKVGGQGMFACDVLGAGVGDAQWYVYHTDAQLSLGAPTGTLSSWDHNITADETAISGSRPSAPPSSDVLNEFCTDDDWGYNNTADDAPLIVDCQQIVWNIHRDGEWRVAAGERQLVQYGSCAFGVRNIDPGIAKVGNGDITRIINIAIGTWGSGSTRKVAGDGAFSCKDLGVAGPDILWWRIYHT